jgi:hypothetical protein
VSVTANERPVPFDRDQVRIDAFPADVVLTY